MKQLVFADAQGNHARYRLTIPDSMDVWRLDAFLDFMTCTEEQMAERNYLPRPVDPLHHQNLRHLVCSPAAVLSRPLEFWQHGQQILGDVAIDLSRPRNLVELRREHGVAAADCGSLDLATRHRREFADCTAELLEIWDELFDFDAHRIVTNQGACIAHFEQVLDAFDTALDPANRMRVLYRLAHLIYQAPFENVSKVIEGRGMRSGLEMWRNIALGRGGMCAEKAWALKFVCDVLGVHNAPVFGTATPLPDDLETRLEQLVAHGSAESLGIWLQHHLLELRLDGRRIVADVANGNMPLLFLTGADAAARLRAGVRARMVYHTEKLMLTRASALAGDTMLVYSQYRVPDLTYQFVFEQGLGLQITDSLFLGVALDWHDQRSGELQQYYSNCARRLGLPFPRFLHKDNLRCVPDADARQLLRNVLEALRDGYPRREYTGDFTVVMQPLLAQRWSRPQVSDEIRQMLGAPEHA